jgi:hypothetical protein
VTTIAIADKNRLTVRGVIDGTRYIVKKEANGWWIEPAPEPRRRVRTVTRAKHGLGYHLKALKKAGFSFEPLPQENVPPCQF